MNNSTRIELDIPAICAEQLIGSFYTPRYTDQQIVEAIHTLNEIGFEHADLEGEFQSLIQQLFEDVIDREYSNATSS
jgi:hypothetical protein